MAAPRDPHMPSEVDGHVGPFDRFAGAAAKVASRAPFFAFCVGLVALWLIQGIVTVATTGDLHTFLNDKFQLEINTTTTIITFLMVALLQNSQTRNDQATQHKLNAIADGLADLMKRFCEQFDVEGIEQDLIELRDAVGIEDRETTTGNGSEDGASVPEGAESR